MNNLYILDGRNPVPCRDLLTWGRWFQKADRHVAVDHIGPMMVSTVFLGLDHNYSAKGPPILFETMILDGGDHEFQRRYATWAEAERGHVVALRLARRWLYRAEQAMLEFPAVRKFTSE